MCIIILFYELNSDFVAWQKLARQEGLVVSAQPGGAKPTVMSERETTPKLAHNRGSAQAVVAPRAGTTKRGAQRIGLCPTWGGGTLRLVVRGSAADWCGRLPLLPPLFLFQFTGRGGRVPDNGLGVKFIYIFL